MRKRIITPAREDINAVSSEQGWLNLAELVEVEVTSEEAMHPIESALLLDQSGGWQAAEPGQQMVRLIFTVPQVLQRVSLHFVETATERTQEYVLRYSPDNGQTFQEVVRQQWNFSPTGSNCATEEHQLELPAVTVLELSITPDIGGGKAVATLEKLRLA